MMPGVRGYSELMDDTLSINLIHSFICVLRLVRLIAGQQCCGILIYLRTFVVKGSNMLNLQSKPHTEVID
jgi:hypothetical protein